MRVAFRAGNGLNLLWGETAMTHGKFRVAAVIAFTGVVFNPAVAQQVAAVPEQVVITARPPDPVGNAAFDTTVLSDQQLEISPRLDTALRQVPGLSLFHRNTSLSTNVFRRRCRCVPLVLPVQGAPW